jgi:thiamine pyrophosphate-dependent acetolactate synthase large subunit-like protein
LRGVEVTMTLLNDYQVHMLRIWQNHAYETNQLHITLENTKTAIRIHFNDFESLADYLQQQQEQSKAT